MSDSNWSRNTAFGLAVFALIITSFGLGAYTVGLSQIGQQGHTAQSAAENAADKPNPASDGSGVTSLPTSDLSESPDSETYYNREDLKAQREMAKWTERMGQAAIAGVFLSLIGIGLIWKTWEETQKAAKAGQTANQIALINSETSLRPWIEVEIQEPHRFKVSVSDGKKEPGFSTNVILRNVGQTPALELRYFAGIFFGQGVKDEIDETLDMFGNGEIDWVDANVFPNRTYEKRVLSSHTGDWPGTAAAKFYVIGVYKTRFSERLRYTAEVWDLVDARQPDETINFDHLPAGDDLIVRKSHDFVGYAT